MEYDPTRKAFAEFLGMFTFVFAVAAAGAMAQNVAGTFGVAMTQGIALGTMIFALGHISGGHFNPVVTLAFLVTRRIEAGLAVVYWLAQFTGAVAAALLVKAILTSPNDSVLGAPALFDGLSPWQGLIWETVLTFFLVLVVFAVAVDPKASFPALAGLGIGLIVAVDVLIGGAVTGASMNPARAFGPQLVQHAWDDWWLYYAGPILGSLAAAIAYTLLFLPARRTAATA